MFAAFAVVIPAIDDADVDAVTAAHKYELTDKILFDAWEKPTADNGLKGKAVALDVTPTGNNFVFDGIVTAGKDTAGTEVSNGNSAWAYLTITGLGSNQITITGTNPALAEITKDASATITDKATGSYSFPIPRAGSGADATVTLKIGDATYTFDFSKVSTATNAAALASGTGVFAGKYTVSDSTKLELNGYTGKDLFYGVTEVTLKGTNTINAYGNADLGHGEGSSAIKAKDNSALTVKAGAEDASLTINQHADAFTVNSAGALTIGDCSNGAKTTTMTIDGGNRGLYSGTSIALYNSVVTISVSEKGIRTTGNASPGTLEMTNSTANVDLKTENKHVNGEETDDRFGVKVTALGTISAGSTLNTDGLRLKTAPTQAIQGKIIIDNYEQNPSAKMTPLIAGFYSDAAVGEPVFAKKTSDTKTAGAIYLINGAEAYNITVQDAKGEVVGKTFDNSADVNNALNGTNKIADVTYTGATGDFLVPEGKTLTLVASSAYNGIIKTGSDAANQSVKFTGFTGTVKVAKGSVQITDGAISAGSIEVKGNTTVVIDNVTITGSDVKFLGEGTVVIKVGKTMTIADGAKLTIGPNVTVEVYGKLLKSGTASANGQIENNGKIVQMSGGQVTITPSANNVSYVESDMKEIKVSGDTEKDLSFSEKQLVTVLDAGLNIYDTVTVAGKLVVPAGAKLTIMAGGKLILTNSAELVVEGTLEIEEASTSPKADAGRLEIVKADVTVSGSIVNNGKIFVGVVSYKETADATTSKDSSKFSTGVLAIAQDGVVTVGENGTITTYTKNASAGVPAEIRGKVVVDKSATLDVKGLIAGSKIYNAGTVTIDSSVAAESGATIYQTADGAAVDVVSYTKLANATADLLITDAGMVLTTYRDSGETVEVTVPSENSVKITPTMESASNEWKVSVSGLKVVSSVGTAKSKTTTNSLANADVGIYNEKQYSKYMDVAGSPAVSYKAVSTATGEKKVSATIEINNSTLETAKETSAVTIIGEVALGENVTLDNKTGKLSVTGMLSAGKDAKIENAGKIVVSKNGEVSRVATTVDNVVAALYETSEKVSGSTVKTYHYVTLDAAIVKMNEAGVKNVVLKADQTVSADGKIPAEATLDLGGHKVTVSKDKTLTVASGATIKNGAEIIVNGTLFAEKKTDLKNINKITANVKSEELGEDGNVKKDGWVKYTSLANALAEAKSGETITLTGPCTLTADTVIPEGVTVVAGENKITLKNGVKLTIDGVLKTDAQIIAESAFALTPMNLKLVDGSTSQYASTVVVNGKLMSAVKYNYINVQPAETSGSNAVLTAGAPVAGAYYEQGAYYVISSLAVAQKEIADITSKITVNGAVSAGDAAFVGTDDCTEIVIGASVGTAPSKIDTVLTVKSLTLSGMKLVFAGATGYFTGSVAIGDASVSAVHANGFTFYEKDSKVYLGEAVAIKDKGDSLTIAAGTVYTDGTLNVTSNTYDATRAAWYNYVTVAAGATLAVDGSATVDYITIDGILDVPSAKTFTVDVQMNVNGTVTVAASTGTAAEGTLNVLNLYIGISDDDLTGAAATFNGPVTLTTGGKILVSSGAAVDDAFVDDLKDMKKTAFNVNGSVWFTAYADAGDVKVTVKNVPVKNVDLVGWNDKDGKKIAPTTGDNPWAITIGADEDLYADINTAIYKVVIKADEGIADVYLNGQAMAYGLVKESDNSGYYYAYSATVAAGDYKVTYTLQNGWSGTATLYKAGTAQSGNAFSVSGNAGESDFTLSGVEKSGYVEPVTPPEDKDDDGLTITDYLLIVLVVLIVIMAIIVAMRLMRS